MGKACLIESAYILYIVVYSILTTYRLFFFTEPPIRATTKVSTDYGSTGLRVTLLRCIYYYYYYYYYYYCYNPPVHQSPASSFKQVKEERGRERRGGGGATSRR